MIAAALLALGLGPLGELCAAPPRPEPTPAPEEAALYAAAGDAERAAGSARTAAIAYRRALALDAANESARQALAALCREDAAAGGSPADALVAGALARYQAGDLDDARRGLEAALALDDGSAAAHFFRGMVAFREGDPGRAGRELDRAAVDPGFAGPAAAMRRLLVRDGRLSVSLLLEPEYDSNVDLLPDTPPVFSTVGGGRGDADTLLLGTIGVRPARGLFLKDTVFWREQLQLSRLDFFGESLQIGWAGAIHRQRLGLRYDFDYDLLDGASYLLAHRFTLGYAVQLASGREVGGSYSFRRRDYETAETGPFTGEVHAASFGLVLAPRTALTLGLAALGQREITRDSAFTNSAAGGQVQLRWRPRADLGVIALAQGLYSRYDELDPEGARREDVRLEGTLDLELDLGDHLALLAGGSLVRNLSSIEDFRYQKVVARAGLAVYWGRP